MRFSFSTNVSIMEVWATVGGAMSFLSRVCLWTKAALKVSPVQGKHFHKLSVQEGKGHQERCTLVAGWINISKSSLAESVSQQDDKPGRTNQTAVEDSNWIKASKNTQKINVILILQEAFLRSRLWITLMWIRTGDYCVLEHLIAWFTWTFKSGWKEMNNSYIPPYFYWNENKVEILNRFLETCY